METTGSMSGEKLERGRVEDALRRIEADESGFNRRTVAHRESTMAELVETLETIREHGVATL
ncbi:MAG: hypothetical protein ABEN55_04335, partial [Bradymonadaceae bacterium]